MNRIRGVAMLLVGLGATGCWNMNLSQDGGMGPLERPRVVEDPDAPTRVPAKGTGGPPGLLSEQFQARDAHVSVLPDASTVVVRLDAPKPRALANRAALRIDVPVGHASGKLGLADLAARAVLDTPDSNGTTLRQFVSLRGGQLDVRVDAESTRFTARLGVDAWHEVLGEIAARLGSDALSKKAFLSFQSDLIRDYTKLWKRDPLTAFIVQQVRYTNKTRAEVVESLQDRHPKELELFRKKHHRPQDAVVSVWLPGVTDPDPVVAATRRLVASWEKARPSVPAAQPKPGGEAVRSTLPAIPPGAFWIQEPGPSRIALVLPFPDDSKEAHILLETLSMDGLGGRLGASLRKILGREMVFTVRSFDGGRRACRIFETRLVPGEAGKIRRAVAEAWSSIRRNTPDGAELEQGKSRVLLELAQRQDRPIAWMAAAIERLRSQRQGGPVRDLHELRPLLHVRDAAARWSRYQPFLVAIGEERPATAADFELVKTVEPVVQTPVQEEEDPVLESAEAYLGRAMRAMGEERRFRFLRGIESTESWREPDGLEALVASKATMTGELNREITVLNTLVQLAVNAGSATETLDGASRAVPPKLADELRNEAMRHPLLLLAAWAQGKMNFRLVGLRVHQGRRVVMLERDDTNQSRLRMTIDPTSGLVRTVESILAREGSGSVIVRESYSDYREIDNLRVPHFREVTTGDTDAPTRITVRTLKVF